MVWNPKPNGLISLKTVATFGQQHKQWVPKDGSSINGLGSSQGQTRLRNEASANDEAKPDAEKGPEEVVAEQNQAQDEKAKVSAEAGTSSRQPPNRTIRFLRVQDRGGS
jgi:hypothetical protein